MKNHVVALGLMAAVLTAGNALAQQNNMGRGTNMVGKESKSNFDQQNQKGAAAVAAIRPTSAPLSQADQALMLEVAKGGMMQLEASRIAVQKTNSDEIRQLAQAEVEEQTGLSNKLKEIAQAKNVTLPSAPDAETQQMLDRMQNMSADELNRHYLQAHAVGGHEKLDAVMSRVKSQAKDANLKNVAQAAHPLVKTHLKVSRDVMNKMGSGMNSGR